MDDQFTSTTVDFVTVLTDQRTVNAYTNTHSSQYIRSILTEQHWQRNKHSYHQSSLHH